MTPITTDIRSLRQVQGAGPLPGYPVASHDVTVGQRHAQELQFLAEAGEALQAPLDYDATLERIAGLVVEFLGNGCIIDALEGDDKLSRMSVVRADPAQGGLAEALEQILSGRSHPVWSVVETRKPALFPEATSTFPGTIATDEDHQRLLAAAGIQSAMIVPAVARGRVVAVLSAVSCRPGHTYGIDDLRLAQELARRAALAFDNALLQDVARAAIRARDEVLGIVAHDLRNPLGAIVAATARLRRRGDEGCGFGTPVEAIERAANRMNRLIEDLLHVTRMDGDILGVERARTDSRQIVIDSVDAQKELAASASLVLRLDLEADLPDVWADRDRLLQAFENLIGNAVKFTQRAGTIDVGARARGQDVQFWVSDNGRGIAAPDVPHLFERFWRAENGGHGGAGLGLSIVKGIVEAHGGRIWVESTPGEGSTFFFTIGTASRAAARLRQNNRPTPM